MVTSYDIKTLRTGSPLALYLPASFLARVADEAMGVAAALLALERTGSAGQGAAVLAAWTAPHVLAAPVTGAVVARARRPGITYVAALSIFAAAIGGVAWGLDRLPLPAVLGIAAVGGCCGPLVTGGMSSLVASLTPADQHSRAYALDSATYTAATLAGPAVITALAGLWSAGTATASLAVTAAVAAVLIGLLRVPRFAQPAHPSGIGAALATGLTTIWHNGPLRGITGATCLAFLGTGGLPIVAVLLAETWTRASDGGLLMTALGLGALVGALTLTRWRPRLSPTALAGVCLVGLGVALALGALSPNLPLGMLAFGVAGLFDGPLLSATLEARSQHSPEHARPQVFTMGAALKISAAAAGTALVGVAADASPVALLLVIGATQVAAFWALRLLPRLPVAATPARCHERG